MTTETNSFKGHLERMGPELEKLLPEGVPADRFKRVALTAIMNDQALMACNPQDLFNELSKCAQDGLYPDKREAAVILYKGRPKYVAMVGGILKRLRNTRELKSLSVQIVKKNDDFSYWIDEQGPHVTFKPKVFEDRGEKIGAFCVATMSNGGTYIEVMNRDELVKIKNLSSAKNGPWKEWEDEMEKKTVIRRISKYLPLSAEMMDSLAYDDEEQSEEPKEVLEIKSVKDLETEIKCEKPLPALTSSLTTSEKPQETKPEKEPENTKLKKPEKFTRTEVVSEIMKLSKELGWDTEKLTLWVTNNFAKTAKQMDMKELLECANILTEFLYCKEGEVKDGN